MGAWRDEAGSAAAVGGAHRSKTRPASKSVLGVGWECGSVAGALIWRSATSLANASRDIAGPADPSPRSA